LFIPRINNIGCHDRLSEFLFRIVDWFIYQKPSRQFDEFID